MLREIYDERVRRRERNDERGSERDAWCVCVGERHDEGGRERHDVRERKRET